MPRTAAAIDLGGTKLAAAFIDETGRILSRAEEPTIKSSLQDTAGQIARLARGAESLGVVVPGIARPSDLAVWAPNVWGAEFQPLREVLQQLLHCPVFIESDRNGHLLGEMWLGAAQGASDALFLACGTGIGVGILSGGRIVSGSAGIAGAAGWLPLAGLWDPAFAAFGCYEFLAAGPALQRRAHDEIARTHGRAIAALVSLFNPEVIVLGGGALRNPDWALPLIHEELLRWAQPIAARQVRIVPSTLGPDAGLYGAARLCFG